MLTFFFHVENGGKIFSFSLLVWLEFQSFFDPPQPPRQNIEFQINPRRWRWDKEKRTWIRRRARGSSSIEFLANILMLLCFNSLSFFSVLHFYGLSDFLFERENQKRRQISMEHLSFIAFALLISPRISLCDNSQRANLINFRFAFAMKCRSWWHWSGRVKER